MQTQIIGKPDSSFKFSQIYSISTYPSVIVPIFTGYAVDKIGIIKTFIIISLISMFGHSIMTLVGYL